MSTNYSGGMSLGELIAQLADSYEYGQRAVMPIGLGMPCSNRGFYSTLAFIAERDVSVADSLARAKSAVGQTYEGWKGGEYTMTLDTEVYLALEPGRSGAPITKECLEMLLALSEWK